MGTKTIKRILISNDDGIDAVGIDILRKVAKKFSDDIWTIAPSENRSGASRSLTLRKDVFIEKLEDKLFRCHGTPSDCIIFGMSQILDFPPDLVLTGINYGMNVADDILYSGTVAGAMEAALLGVPAIALSQRHGPDKTIGYKPSQLFCEKVVRHILSLEIPPRVIANVNFPAFDPKLIKGIKPAQLDKHKIGDVVVAGEELNHYRLGPLKSNPETGSNSDRAVLNNGWISLTPLKIDVTARTTLKNLSTISF